MSGSTHDRPQIRIEEQSDHDGALRLALAGELDIAVVDTLDERLMKLKRAGRRVRLDLAELEFTDSTGLRELTSPSLMQNGTAGTWRSTRTSAKPSGASSSSPASGPSSGPNPVSAPAATASSCLCPSVPFENSR